MQDSKHLPYLSEAKNDEKVDQESEIKDQEGVKEVD